MSYPPISAELNAMIPEGAFLIPIEELNKLHTEIDRLHSENTGLTAQRDELKRATTIYVNDILKLRAQLLAEQERVKALIKLVEDAITGMQPGTYRHEIRERLAAPSSSGAAPGLGLI